MNPPSRRRAFLSTLSSLAYISILFVISLLSEETAYRAACLVGRARFRWQTYRKGSALTLRALLVASRFQTTPAEVMGWLRRASELVACEDLECWLYPRWTKEKLAKLVKLDGLENLTAALARGRGAVLYGAHMRSGFTMPIALSLLGYRLTMLKRERALGNWIERLFHDRRERFMEKLGIKFLYTYPPSPFSAARALGALKSNGILFAMVDTRKGGFPTATVQLVNGPAILAQGPALIAQSGRAPLLHFWLHRHDGVLPLTATIGSPIYAGKDVVATVQEQACRLEQEIRREPASWWLTDLENIFVAD